jgi:TolB-like protein/DNA-binding winged helix-turn-helix (wHTH) protein
MGGGLDQIYEFGPYRVDPDRRQLLRGDQAVALGPKTFDVLLLLVRNSGRVLSKDEIMKEVWADTFVEEANLPQHIAMLRKALGETAQAHHYIITLPGHGYRFAGEVHILTAGDHDLHRDSQSHAQIKHKKLSRWRLRTTAALLGAVVIAGAAILAIRLARTSLSPATESKRVMLAVLPFQNLSNDPQQEYFSDGLTEETITDLGGVSPEKLGVIARTSTMRYKLSNKPLRQIAQELGVDYILEGSARRDARSVRISAQLIRANDQTHIWARSYDRDLSDLLALQDEIGAAIAREVQVKLNPEQGTRANRGRIDPEAQDDYLKGRYLWNKFTPEAQKKSIEYYQRALERDPTYALAYAGLSESYSTLMDLSVLRPAEAYPMSEAAAHKAVELDSGNSQAHSALGWQLLAYERDFKSAENEFRWALKLNESNPEAHEGLGNYFAVQGQFDQALAEINKAREMDPLSLIVSSEMGQMLFYARHYDQAIQQLRATINLDPDFPASHYFLIRIYQARGMHEDAYKESFVLWTIGGQMSKPILDETRRVHTKSGWSGVVKQSLSRMLQARSAGRFVSAYDIAEDYLALGQEEETVTWLQQAVEEHANQVIYLNVDPRFDRLHVDRKFQDLIRRIDVPAR